MTPLMSTAAAVPKAEPAEPAALTAAVQALIEAHCHLEGPLLPLLHAVQGRFGHVPRAAVPQIARALNLSRAEVHGVVSYYHHFRSEPAGRHVLQVCRAESCQARGGEALLAHARAHLGCSEAAPTSADGAWTVEPVYCLGLCAQSPAALLDERLHARLNPAKLARLIEATQGAEVQA